MNDPGAAWQHAMRHADFAAAWRINDTVLAARDRITRDDPKQPYHERWVWDGTPPDGQDVLVRCYHGLGDTLQFARFLPGLRARAARVTVECQPSLLPLLARFGCVDRLHPFDQAHPMPAFPCDIEIMELGHVLRPDANQIASLVPYLQAEAAAVPQGMIALCWESSGWDTLRSIAVDTLLEALPTGTFISLQRGAKPMAGLAARFHNPHDDDVSVLNTAGQIMASSQVVTVDTMVAHLAGALGHPGVVLLKNEADWRWSERDGRSAWYPSLRFVALDALKRKEKRLWII